MRCACCGEESDILICLDPFSLLDRPQLSNRLATYCCEYCGSMIIRELMQHRTEAKNTQLSTTDQVEMLSGKARYVDRWNEPVERDSIKFAVLDAYGQNHSFQIRWHDLGAKRSYRTEEIYRVNKTGRIATGEPTSEYEFAVLGYIKNEKHLVKELVHKTVTGLHNPTLSRSEAVPGAIYSNAVLIQKSSVFQRSVRARNCKKEPQSVILSAKETGTLRILDDCNGNLYFQIDGRHMDAEDVVKAFSPYAGFQLQYQIRDETQPLLEDDMLLMPMKLNLETLTGELQELIALFSEKHRGSFIRERDVSSFDICFFKLMEKLELYYNAHPRGKGKLAGIEMIKLLNELDTDDDLFPEYEIECIQRIIGDI